ncbi:MAG: hypothetical protein AAGA85_17975 [Bacteroidota bacterium]
MRRKNQWLLVAFVILLISNVVLMFSNRATGTIVKTNQFAVADTTLITRILIQGNNEQNTLERTSGGWQLNGKYSVDRYLRKILFAVLQEVSVRRELSPSEVSRFWEQLDERGYEVKLAGVENAQFHVIGNEKYTRTYFLVDDQEGYEVEIPGYRDYVGGIFQLTSDQWRNRELFRGSFNSLQSVVIDHQQGEDLSIEFGDRFFSVEGVSDLDSGRLVNYLRGFESLQANEIVSAARFVRYDSLSGTVPMAIVQLVDIAWNRPFELRVFPMLPGERIHLAVAQDGTMAVFQASKIQQLLARPQDFRSP